MALSMFPLDSNSAVIPLARSPVAWFAARPVRFWFTLVVLVFLAYAPVWRAGFVWDDDAHVTKPELRSFAGLVRIWSEPGATQQYYPLLHSAFWLEHRLWGDAPAGYHWLNLLLHATAAALFGRLLLRLAVPGWWLSTAIFALHPVCVESVAWISEQKNTLSAIFALSAAITYLRFDAQPRRGTYLLATGLFAAAVLTKTVTAVLPAALWVILWWRDGRLDFRAQVRPLVPWLGLGLLAGSATAWVEHELIGAKGAEFSLGLVERLLLAGRIPFFYLGKLAWPANLMFIYPKWDVRASDITAYLYPAALLAVLTALFI
ncbi:MAG TPA: hypothetical protein VFJ90_02775, partial [Candidatus Didemnitutus sp.]|nr:hypothetical protein [Candidatus Didemnitutus sp.]